MKKKTISSDFYSMLAKMVAEKRTIFSTMLCLILQGEFNYSEEILNGEMARIIYRDAAQKIKGD